MPEKAHYCLNKPFVITGNKSKRALLLRLQPVILVLFFLLSNTFPVLATDTQTEFVRNSAPNFAAPAVNPKNPRQFQYFAQTGHSISGSILRFYRDTGGLNRHGLPLSELLLYKGKYLQYFERTVIEFLPRYVGTRGEAIIQPIGIPDQPETPFNPIEPFSNKDFQWYLPETGHSLSEPFLSFWRNNGGKEVLGLPISETFYEEQANGKKLEVQYFELSKLENHPEAKAGFEVQIALSGSSRAEKELSPEQLKPKPLNQLTEPRTLKIPSLMFHYMRVVDKKKDLLGYNLSVTPDNFAKLADWLKNNGYNTVTIEQILDSLKYGVQLPPNPVNLRFDDGHADMWQVYQELKKREMTATFYVITRRLELLPEQWRQIDQDGFEVAAHTRNHPDLRGSNNWEGEITGSKLDLEAILGHPVRTFAYPYGKYNNSITQVVINSGFELAVTTEGGYNWSLGTTFKQPTVSVVGDDTLNDFIGKVKAGR
jgi:peptidoglycan/xylan/chitin deacetylase (PgdA/CDA1 family)